MYLQHLYQMFIDAHLPRKCAQPLSSLQKHESIYFNDSCFHRHRRKYWTNSFQMNRTIWLQMSQPDCFSWRMAVREKGSNRLFLPSFLVKQEVQAEKNRKLWHHQDFLLSNTTRSPGHRHLAQLPSNGFKAPTFGSISRKGVVFN